MSLTTPLLNLFVFAATIALLSLLFWPSSGLLWRIMNRYRLDEKSIVEDMLKLLYHNETKGFYTSLNQITAHLPSADKSILKALRKMSEKCFIQHSNESITLTDQGRVYALKVIRGHRLWEKHLAERTGFDRKEWHERAEKMEHKLTDEQVQLLETELGNPVYDPHGDPIPTDQGQVVEVAGIPLSSLPESSTGKIIHIEDEPKILYKKILSQNIHIGSVIKVLNRGSADLILSAEGENYSLDLAAASNIEVIPIEPEDTSVEHLSRLSYLKPGEHAVVVGISKDCRGMVKQRLLDLGFVKGTPISIDFLSPLKTPIAYNIKGSSIAIREDQAKYIHIAIDKQKRL